MYLPTSQGGLDLIELGSFFKGMTLSWIRRYVIDKYNDFWTSILDEYLGLTPETRHHVLKWGDQEFVNPLKNAKIPYLNQIISTLQHFVFVFPSDPETGDNSYACQPIFKNSHLTFLRTVNNKKIYCFYTRLFWNS